MTTLRSLLTPEGLNDPYAIYDAFRADQAAGRDIGPIMVDYDNVVAALTDRGLSSDRVPGLMSNLDPVIREETALVERTLADIIAFQDPPDHDRLRRLLAKALTPRMARRQTESIQRAADHLVTEFARHPSDANGRDIIDAITFPLPALVIASLLGVPETEFERFQAWGRDIVFFVGSGEIDADLALRTNESMLEMRAYMTDLVERRRRDPAEDLLTEMIAASDEGDRLATDELYANAVFLMTAGHETATNMLSNALLTLLRHPDQLARLRADGDLLEPATEEMLRYESPVQITARFVRTDGEVCGRRMHAGEALTLVLGAANRDPAAFPDPHTFDIARRGKRHVAFALGAHYCLGAPLARQEMRTVLALLFRTFPKLALADDHIEWQRTLSFRGPTRLLVSW